MIKRAFTLILACVISLSTLCACAPQEDKPADGTPAVTTPDTTEPEATTTPKEVTEAITTTPEVTTTEPTTTVATTTTQATTTTEATTTVATTTTEATTTTVTTTTEATTTTAAPEPVELGVLGYNLKEKISTDKAYASGKASSLVINEVCPSNKKTLDDMDGESKDWVEIYNPTDKIINLEGVGLSDDSKEPFKWVFPSVNIQPKGYIIVFASDKNITKPELHTNFKISGGNEELILTSADGKTIDSFIVSTTDEDQTYGRYPDGSDSLRLLSATPGKSNGKAKDVEETGTLKPIFSKESGFYDQQFSLKITAEPGCTIYYTTDGSVPTKKSTKYTDSITIKDRSGDKAILTYKKDLTVTNDSHYPNKEFEKATIIRAIAVDKNGVVSDVTTATYFVSASIAKKYGNVDVISVVMDPNDLYNPETGIYVAGKTFEKWRKEHPTDPLDGNSQANFNQRGREWERDGHIDYFSSTDLEFSADVGVRIHGGWSRNSNQKSLRFYFREEYGQNKLDYKLFEDNYSLDNGKIIDSYKRFLIRNGGNDSYLMTFKDPWTQSLFDEFEFGTQATNLVICFLDGEYWGLYTACESLDKHYVEEKYGVPDEDVIVMKNNELNDGDEEGDGDLWTKTRRYIRDNDMTKPENYKKACDMLDMDSFAQYIAAEIYIGNEDWMWNNASWWRSRSTDKADSPYQDGKWRFMMFDVEFAMNLYGDGRDVNYNILDDLLNGDGFFGPMLKSLLKNDDFKQRFVTACEDVMNIAFNKNFATNKLKAYYNEYSPYIDQHMDRFIGWQSVNGVKKNVEHWSKWVANRPTAFLTILKEELGIKGKNNAVTIQVNDSAMGSVMIDGHELPMTSNSWSGTYISGYKITIEAVPAKGYEFVGWSGGYDGDARAITVNPGQALTLKANFKKK